MKLLTVDRPADPMSQDLYRVLGADRLCDECNSKYNKGER